MSFEHSYFLGIDCGGTTIKSALYDECCNEISHARHTFLAKGSEPGIAERNLIELKAVCFATIREAIAKANINAKKIKAVAISAQGKGLFPIYMHPKAEHCGILSADRRAVEVVRKWIKEGIPQKLYPITRQTLWTGHPVSILRWLKENRKEDYDDIKAVQMSHDYLRYCLTGEICCEITNISESNLFNMKDERYDETLAENLGIPEVADKLPPIVGSCDICGYVTAEAAKLTGLEEKTPVAGGLFDVVSVAVCAGLNDTSAINAAMGTWAVATGITDKITDDKHPFVYGRHAVPGYYIIHEASPTSSGNLEWVCRMLELSDFSKINTLVESLPKGADDIYFLPFIYGSNASLDATGCFYGLQSVHSKADLFKAAFEGVIFSQVKHLKSIMRKFDKTERVIVTGGAAHSKVWMQIFADTLQLPVVLPQVEETGCLGAALCAQTAVGLFNDINEARTAYEPNTSIIEPDPTAAKIYEEKYERYSELVNCIGIFHERVGKRKYLTVN